MFAIKYDKENDDLHKVLCVFVRFSCVTLFHWSVFDQIIRYALSTKG